MSRFMKIRLVRDESFHTDRRTHRQTDRYEEGRKFANALNRNVFPKTPSLSTK